MTFTPPTFTVRQRETVRLRVRNLGKDLHELVLRTPEYRQRWPWLSEPRQPVILRIMPRT